MKEGKGMQYYFLLALGVPFNHDITQTAFFFNRLRIMSHLLLSRDPTHASMSIHHQ